MSKPYRCGHERLEDHDDYCGVGMCMVCSMAFQRDGFAPHGEIMEAERVLEVYMLGHEEAGPILRVAACDRCGAAQAIPELDQRMVIVREKPLSPRSPNP